MQVIRRFFHNLDLDGIMLTKRLLWRIQVYGMNTSRYQFTWVILFLLWMYVLIMLLTYVTIF